MSTPKIILVMIFFFLFILWLGMLNGAQKTVNEGRPLAILNYNIMFDHSHSETAVVFQKGEVSVGDTVLVRQDTQDESDQSDHYFFDSVTSVEGEEVTLLQQRDDTVVLGVYQSDSEALAVTIRFFGSRLGMIIGIVAPLGIFFVLFSLSGKKQKEREKIQSEQQNKE